MTYSEVIKTLENIANDSIFIKDFVSGRLSDINDIFTKGTKEFPKMWVTPQNTTINKNSVVYSLEVDILDICTDASNANVYAEKVISDCTAIFNDVVTKLEFNLTTNEAYTESPITLTPYFEKPSEYVAGVTGTINIIVDRNNAFCKA